MDHETRWLDEEMQAAPGEMHRAQTGPAWRPSPSAWTRRWPATGVWWCWATPAAARLPRCATWR
ncbi:MAG: hypothetical protein R2854_18920 [Caldilineaceae bacterium]